ncbi:MAG TPA: hypothetical protein VMZ50_09200 [Phycisphaerae bacterium]|nr:hypothetical protein [Phycisphaerae bacterium]
MAKKTTEPKTPTTREGWIALARMRRRPQNDSAGMVKVRAIKATCDNGVHYAAGDVFGMEWSLAAAHANAGVVAFEPAE